MAENVLTGKTVAFHTLGCKVNLYETESMQQQLEAAGMKVVPFETAENADVFVINTCSVTNIADKKSRQMLRRAKSRNEAAVIVAVGCYAQIQGRHLIEEGLCNILVGTNQKNGLAMLLGKWFEDRVYTGDVEDVRYPVPYEEQEFLTRVENHTRAFIKIQEGCNQFCSYCLIPFARGRIRSRSLDSIVEELKLLTDESREDPVKEIVLTGIHLSSYDWMGKKLIDVVEAVCGIPGVKRVRIGSLEPRVVTEEFAARLAAQEKVCPHFHLSLQSGCDSVLKRMNRHYTTAEYREGCEILRRYFTRPAITTDVIAGFPGESEEEFEESLAFAREIGFYEMHVFPYSKRTGTAADKMPGQLPEAVKKARANRLIEAEREMSVRYRMEAQAEGADRTYSVLFEEICEIGGEKYLTGYTKEYIRVAVPAGSGVKAGEIRNVHFDDRFADSGREIVLAEP